MECESGITRSVIDYLHFGIFKEIKRKLKVVLLEVPLMNFILGISKEIEMKLKVVLVKVSLMNFILGICNEIKF